MAPSTSAQRAATRWTFRLVPVLMVGIFGVSAYAVVGRLCVRYIYQQQNRRGLAAGLLAVFFLFFILTILSYAKVVFTIQLDPGLVPLTSGRNNRAVDAAEKRQRFRSRRNRDPEDPPWFPPDTNPDSPGLEAFYSKDVFACEVDGRPKWCSECRQWKPDRAHHSSELGRCVKKMDHLCPWVGGMVSETSFNFFLHFTFYATCLCSICLAISIYCITQQLQEPNIVVDGWVIAVIALSALFGLFAFGMTLTAGRYIFINVTNIDMLRKSQMITLAVRIPRGTPPSTKYQTITYPLVPIAPGTLMTNQYDSAEGSPSTRDQQAFRTFAILRTEPHENPWDLGYWKNWKSVMGNKPVEWFLPIRHSPCCRHDSMTSDYPLGPVLDELKKRYEIPDTSAGKTYAHSV